MQQRIKIKWRCLACAETFYSFNGLDVHIDIFHPELWLSEVHEPRTPICPGFIDTVLLSKKTNEVMYE